MYLTHFQRFMNKERRRIIEKFQKRYKTTESKEKVLKILEDKDINFLIYCSDNLYLNIFYSKFLKKDKNNRVI